MRPLKATINHQALLSNFKYIKKVANQSKVMSVLKANAYGHNLIDVAKTLKKSDGFAVLSIDEAIQLRKNNFDQTILLLEGFFGKEEVNIASELKINVTVHNQRQIDLINQSKPDNISAFIYLGRKHRDKKRFYSLSKSSNLEEAASNLYRIFRLIKKKGFKKIQIEKIPSIGPGIAINDRIKRAAYSK